MTDAAKTPTADAISPDSADAEPIAPDPIAPDPIAELRRLLARMEGDAFTLGGLVEGLGDRAVAMLLLLLTLPAMVPTPGVPAGAVVGTVICLISLQMLVGESHLHLPPWLGRRAVSRSLVNRIIDLSEPWMRRAGRLLVAGRLPRLVRPGTLRTLAPLIFLMGFLIALPIPFGNVVPALSLLAISLGAFLRDGGAVAAGVGIGAAALVVCVALTIATFRLAEMALT